MASQSPPINFCSVLSETKRIISAHSRHFLALTVLFILPLSFSTTIYSTLQYLLTTSQIHSNTQILLRHHPATAASTTNLLVLPLIYTLLSLLLSLLAVGSISFSVYHGFFGRPVKLLSSILSLRRSFFPLLSTFLAALLVQFLISFAFVLFLFLITKAFDYSGLDIDYSSPYSIGFVVLVGLCLLIALIYFQVNYLALANVVVVVESSWGFEPLRRSAYLVKGMRGLAISLLLFYGFVISFLIWGGSISDYEFSGSFSGGKICNFVLRIVATTTTLMIMMLNSISANTVLYMHCKAVHGELAAEIAEEFAREYVSLPFDDGKVPHLVTVIPN